MCSAPHHPLLLYGTTNTKHTSASFWSETGVILKLNGSSTQWCYEFPIATLKAAWKADSVREIKLPYAGRIRYHTGAVTV